MYLGRNPAVGTQKMLDSIESQFNGTLTTFDLRYGGNPTYPTLSESLIVSLGGVLQEPGDAYYVSSDKIVFSEAPNAGTECWILLYSQYGEAASAVPALAIQGTGEPMGFPVRYTSNISFDNSTKTFTISPIITPAGDNSFEVWTKGIKRIYTTAQSVTLVNGFPPTGLYYIYFDTSGTLRYRTTYFDWAYDTPVAYVYWNKNTSSAPFVADERHGIVLDWQTHEYLHRTRGAVIAEGFSISNYTTTGDGSANADAQFDLANGTFFDEDLEVNITHSASPTVGTFTQVLQGAAEIPVFYLDGPDGLWVKDTATEYAAKLGFTGDPLRYNSYGQGWWSTPSATDNRYVVSWIVATNEINAPVIAILGQAQYSNIGEAEATRFGDLTLTNFPIVEFRPLWKVIFRTSSGYTNTPKAYIAGVLDLRQLSETGEAGTVVSDHGLLSGLADDDHAQYLHASVDRAGTTANITTTGNITAANLIATGQLQGPANFVIDPAAVGDNTGTVEIKGNLTVQGTTTTINSTTVDLDHLALGDNERFTIGDGGTGDNNVAGKDLEIYSDGSNLYFDSPYIYTGDQGVSPSIYFRTSKTTTLDTNALTILNTGNIGIGTNSPGSLLDIYYPIQLFSSSRVPLMKVRDIDSDIFSISSRDSEFSASTIYLSSKNPLDLSYIDYVGHEIGKVLIATESYNNGVVVSAPDRSVITVTINLDSSHDIKVGDSFSWIISSSGDPELKKLDRKIFYVSAITSGSPGAATQVQFQFGTSEYPDYPAAGTYTQSAASGDYRFGKRAFSGFSRNRSNYEFYSRLSNNPLEGQDNSGELATLIAGSVGIGTTNPLTKLDIYDSGSPNITLRGSAFPSIRLAGTDGTTDAEIYYGMAGNDLNISNLNSGIISLNVEGSSRLKISGNNLYTNWADGSFLGTFYDANYYMGFTFGATSRELYIDNKSNDTRADIVFRTLEGAGTPTERLRITSTGNVGIGTTNPDAKLHVYRSDETGYALTSDQRSEAEVRITNPSETSNTFSSLHFYNGAGTGGDISLNSIFTGTDYISDFTIKIRTGGGSNDWRERLRIEGSDGDVLPGEDATQDFGSPTKRWANIYSADLQLSNEGSANEVDGTWGAYTIQEGEEALYLINRRSGKKFKFVLEEVKD